MPSGNYSQLPDRHDTSSEIDVEIDSMAGIEAQLDNQPSSSQPDAVAGFATSTRTMAEHRQEVDGAHVYPPPVFPSSSRSPSTTSRWTSSDSQADHGQQRPTLWRRAVGALLPQYYTLLPTSEPNSSAVRGSGLENDGVFSNVIVKPTSSRVVESNGNVHVMPEVAQKDVPPSYDVAQADAVPPYTETATRAPSGSAECLVDGLPVGNVFSFASSLLISTAFQFVGFMLTYLMHTTHAAKYGSRAGLGLTLVQYGFYSRNTDRDMALGGASQGAMGQADADVGMRRFVRHVTPSFWAKIDANGSSNGGIQMSLTAHDWLAFLLMAIGWFLVIHSVIAYLRIKRLENSSRDRDPVLTRENLEHDMEVRERLQAVFNLGPEHFGDLPVEEIGGPSTRRT